MMSDKSAGATPMWLLVPFVAVPILEIALFIQIGSLAGLWPTLAIVVLTAVVGTFLVRMQGVSEINRLRRSLAGHGNPAESIAHGAFILAAGLLLLTPGFFTDGVGFLLLMPPVRIAVLNWLSNRFADSVIIEKEVAEPTGGMSRRSDTIDGEYDEVRDPADR